MMAMGCAKPSTVLRAPGSTTSGAVVRVQSSYGDLQQAEVMVLRWIENGQSNPPLERRMTPFDIPVNGNTLELQLSSPDKGPSLKVLYIDASGQMKNYVQSTRVCIASAGQSAVTLRDCKVGLR